MRHLVDTTNLKKKFCNHDFKILYPNGSNEPIEHCNKCTTSRKPKIKKLKIKNEKLIQYMYPAFEQSDVDPNDEWRLFTNYKEMSHDGFSIPGTKEEHYWCGTWHWKGCLNLDGHKNCEHKGKIFVKQYKKSCFRASCRKCYPRWMIRQSNRGTRRMEKYGRKAGVQPIHVALSIPERQYYLSVKKLKKIANIVVKEIGLKGGAIIFHPYRKKYGVLYYSPHFHVIAFGTTVRRSLSYYKYGWVIIDKGFRKSVFGTFYYILSHCGVKKGFQAVTWFGDLSYSKLKLEKEPDSNICPACGCKLVPIHYIGVYPAIPPGEIFEGFVDPEGWYEEETIPEDKLKEPYHFEYASTRDLNETLKGIALAD